MTYFWVRRLWEVSAVLNGLMVSVNGLRPLMYSVAPFPDLNTNHRFRVTVTRADGFVERNSVLVWELRRVVQAPKTLHALA